MSMDIAETTTDKGFVIPPTPACRHSLSARRKMSPRALTRIGNVRKRRSEDSIESNSIEQHSIIGDSVKSPNQATSALPLLLNIPVTKLNNDSLTEIPESTSCPPTRRLPVSPRISIRITQHNNNVCVKAASPLSSSPTGGGDDGEDSEDSNCSSIVDTDEDVLDVLASSSPEIDDSAIEKAIYKRRFVLMELLETERSYVHDISLLVNGYMEEINKVESAEGLRRKEKIVFGNIRAILAFHKDKFLPDIEKSHDNPQELAALFTKYERQLRLYVTYCENKPRSEYLVTEYSAVFQEIAMRLKQRLQIQDLLIKPVQRIMKYQLLLKDILKHTEKSNESTLSLHKAMDVMHTVPKAANNMMEVGRLHGFDVKLPVHGTVLLQDTLPVAEFNIKKPGTRKYKPRRVFLFEQIFIISDLYESQTKGRYYKYRTSIKLSDMRLVDKVFEEPSSFILSHTINTDIDTYIQTPSVDVKEEWTRQIQSILDKQTDFLYGLEDPLGKLRLTPPPAHHRRSGMVSRSQSDRPETQKEQNQKHKKYKSKDTNPRQNHTIH